MWAEGAVTSDGLPGESLPPLPSGHARGPFRFPPAAFRSSASHPCVISNRLLPRATGGDHIQADELTRGFLSQGQAFRWELVPARPPVPLRGAPRKRAAIAQLNCASRQAAGYQLLPVFHGFSRNTVDRAKY